jgi:kynurenine formamidase
MALTAPSEQELVGWLDAFADHGRWPEPDRGLGTLNHITPAVRLAATASVRDGLVVGCGREIAIEPGATDVLIPPVHRTISTEPQTPEAPVVTTASDELGVPAHGVTITHLDSLRHFAVDERGYGGLAAAPLTAADAAAPGGVHELRDGILTRGVLLDVAALQGRPWLEAGEPILPEDLERAEQAAGTRVGAGDALLLRTGWSRRRAELGPYPERKQRPGLHAATLPWLRERAVALVASDAAHDVVPSTYTAIPMPIHTIGIVAMGLCLLDGCDFERLADALRERGRATCLFVVAPLVFRNATGSPVNPLAVL